MMYDHRQIEKRKQNLNREHFSQESKNIYTRDTIVIPHMKKLLLLLCVILLLSLSVHADIAPINTTYRLWATITEGATYVDVDHVTLNITNPDGSPSLTDALMINNAQGVYYYDVVFTEEGNWLSTATFYNTTSPVATQDQTTTVSQYGGESMDTETIVLAIAIGFIYLFIWKRSKFWSGFFILITGLTYSATHTSMYYSWIIAIVGFVLCLTNKDVNTLWTNKP